MDSPTKLVGNEIDSQTDRSIDGDSIPLGFGGHSSSKAVAVVGASYQGGVEHGWACSGPERCWESRRSGTHLVCLGLSLIHVLCGGMPIESINMLLDCSCPSHIHEAEIGLTVKQNHQLHQL
jgi:hypothetical protein